MAHRVHTACYRSRYLSKVPNDRVRSWFSYHTPHSFFFLRLTPTPRNAMRWSQGCCRAGKRRRRELLLFGCLGRRRSCIGPHWFHEWANLARTVTPWWLSWRTKLREKWAHSFVLGFQDLGKSSCSPHLDKLAWRMGLTVREEVENQTWTRGLWWMSTATDMAEFGSLLEMSDS